MAGLQSIRRTRVCKRGKPPAPPIPARRGYTLIELLIVVAVLSVILTLTLPSLRHMSAKSELQDTARQIRVRLLEARLRAIESGSLTYFRYQVGGDQFEIGRAASPGQPSAGAASTSAGQGGVAIESATEPQTLPLGMRFADPSADRPSESPATADGSEGDASWSAPLLFFPNGRTFDARIALVSASYRAELRVRGLTGTVQVSRAERLLPPEAESVPDVRVSPNSGGAAP